MVRTTDRRWLPGACLAAWSAALGCGSGERGDTVAGEPLGPITIAELSEIPGSTTPDAITLGLGADADSVTVLASVWNDAGPVTPCQEITIDRSAPAGVDWPVGSGFEVPLSYEVALPPDEYVHVVLVYASGLATGLLESMLLQFFEVTEGGVVPISDATYSEVSERRCGPGCASRLSARNEDPPGDPFAGQHPEECRRL